MQKQHKANILCVDDEPNILKSLRRVFRKLDYGIFTAESGAEGLKILKANTIHLVISDLKMPEMDGAEFLTKVREQHPAVARILLTGYSDFDSTIKAINDGKISSFISKPWEDDQLLQTVQSALKVHFLQKERNNLLKKSNVQNQKLKKLSQELEQKVKIRTQELEQVAQMYEMASVRLEKSNRTLVNILSNVISLRPYTLGKSTTDMSTLCKRIAKTLELNSDSIEQVEFASLLIELGKLGMPDSILSIPLRKMNETELNEFSQYPTFSEACLLNIENMGEAKQIIRQHCEYEDGTGFPEGIKGDEICIGAKIVSIAKEYYVLRNGMFDGKKYTHDQAADYVFSLSGVKFESKVTNAFIKAIKALASPEQGYREVKINTQKARPGMKLSKNCMSEQGLILVAKDTELTDEIIEKLRTMERRHKLILDLYIKAKADQQ